jgi:two-component system KDP operon response regulator KdpE
VFELGRLAVDLQHRLVTVEGQAVKLSVTEYALLRELVRHAGQVMTHRQLLRAVWGPEYEAETQYLRVYIGLLRRKLEADPSNPALIVTDPGVGYKLAVPA